MSIKRLKIEYTSNDWTTNFVHQLWIQITGQELYYPVYVIKDSPSSPTDVQKGVTITQTVQNIKDYLDATILAAGLQDYIYTERDTNILYIYYGTAFVDGEGCVIYLSEHDPADEIWSTEFGSCSIAGSFLQATVTTETVGSSGPPVDVPVGTFTPVGLTGNGFKINNDIFLKIPSNTNGTTSKVVIALKNLSTHKTTGNLEGYAIDGSDVTFNLCTMLKSIMPKPLTDFDYSTLLPFAINNNYMMVEIFLRRYYYPTGSNILAYDEVIMNKAFIRSGERTNKSNLTIPINSKLRASEQLPIWAGYPTAEYQLNPDFEIIKLNNLSTLTNKEYRHFSGCENFYIKFLNQWGGYSYWLFTSFKGSNDSKNLGYSNTFGSVSDFGNDEDISNEVTGKIPLKYMGLMKDLIVSPEIYLYTGSNTWERIVQLGNKVPDISGKRVYEVSFKFEKATNFNPSVLW